MSQTSDRCDWVSPNSVALTLWGWSFLFYLRGVLKILLSELVSCSEQVLLRSFLFEKASLLPSSTWMPKLMMILMVLL
jgi:hypothetical protein